MSARVNNSNDLPGPVLVILLCFQAFILGVRVFCRHCIREMAPLASVCACGKKLPSPKRKPAGVRQTQRGAQGRVTRASPTTSLGRDGPGVGENRRPGKEGKNEIGDESPTNAQDSGHKEGAVWSGSRRGPGEETA